MSDDTPIFEEGSPLPDDNSNPGPSLPGPAPEALPGPAAPKFDEGSPVDQVPKFEDSQPIEEESPKFEDSMPVNTPSSAEGHFEAGMRGLTFGASDAIAAGMRKAASRLGVPNEYLNYVAPAPAQMAIARANNPNASEEEIGGQLLTSAVLPGTSAIGTALQMGLMGAGDELSKYILGEGDSSKDVAAHIALNTLLGWTGAKYISPSISKMINANKLGTAIKSLFYGAEQAARVPMNKALSLTETELDPFIQRTLSNREFKAGQQIYNMIPLLGVSTAAGATGHLLGEGFKSSVGTGMLAGGVENKIQQLFSPYFEEASQKYIAPLITRIAKSGKMDDLAFTLNHIQETIAGNKAIQNATKALFKTGSDKAVDFFINPDNREKVKDAIKNRSLSKQVEQPEQEKNMAEGGEVPPNEGLPRNSTFEQLYPLTAMHINESKMRVYNYLSDRRPGKMPGLPYDNPRTDKNEERKYDQLIDMGLSPLSILNDVKSGRLTPNKLNDFKSMFPELHQEISKHMLGHISEQKHNEERPKHKFRQAMSLFIGSNLDSTLNQPVMALAQSTFLLQQPQQPSMPAKKGSKQSLSKAPNDSLTSDQAREKREQKV